MSVGMTDQPPSPTPHRPARRCRRRTALLTLGGLGGLLLATGCELPIQRLLGAPAPTFPAWVNTMPRGGEAYTAAFSNLDLMSTLACYCGCMAFADPHGSLKDCFVQASGEISTHGAFCETCQDEAIDAVAMAKAGQDWAAIRRHVDETYASRAPEFGGSGCGGTAMAAGEHADGAACGP